MAADERQPSLHKAEGALRLLHLTDLHVTDGGSGSVELDVVRWWLSAAPSAETDVVVVSGDLVDNALDLAAMRAVKGALDCSGLAWLAVPGNHDVPEPGAAGAFEVVFGRYPRVEETGGVRFALLDSNRGLPRGERPLSERTFGRLFCLTDGLVGEEQLGQVTASLRGPGPKVLVLHHHLARQAPEPVKRYVPIPDNALGMMSTLRDADQLLDWAARQGIGLVLHGHKHAFARAGIRRNGIVVLNGGSSTRTTPWRARLVDITPDGRATVTPVRLVD
jgi:3',5'-cyclic AMP phosphodiesterase CpdA